MGSFNVPVTLEDGRQFNVPVDGVETADEAAAAIQDAIDRGELDFGSGSQTPPETPEEAFSNPTMPMPQEEQAATGSVTGLSGAVQDVGPQARAAVPPPGVDPAEWEQLSFDQRIAMKNQETQARQERLLSILPPEYTPTVSEDGVKSYGDSVPLRKEKVTKQMALGKDPGAAVTYTDTSAVKENELRSRGIETRESDPAVSGVTITLMNIAPPPVIEDPEDEEQVTRFLDWRGKMRVSLAESLKRDFQTDGDIGVQFDEQSNEWVYLNPSTGAWTSVISRGLNDEDLSALFTDPAQTATLAGEIALSTALAFYTGGAGLVAGESAIGAAGAATSQYIRNKRAQGLGFQQGSTEGVGTAAVVGGVGGAIGGSIANRVGAGSAAKSAAGRKAGARGRQVDNLRDARANKNLAREARAESELGRIDNDVRDITDDIIEAEKLGTPRKVRKAAEEQRQARQNELDRGMDSLRTVTAKTERQVETPTATTGPSVPGLQDAEEQLAGRVRSSVEHATKPSESVASPAMRIKTALLRVLDKVADDVQVHAAARMKVREQTILGAARVHAKRALNAAIDISPTTGRSNLEVQLNLPVRNKINQVRTAVNAIRESIGGADSPALDALNEALTPLVGRTRVTDDVILNGSDIVDTVQKVDRLLHGSNVFIGKAEKELLSDLREQLVANLGREARRSSPDNTARSGVQRWADVEDLTARSNATPQVGENEGNIMQLFFDSGGSIQELADAGIMAGTLDDIAQEAVSNIKSARELLTFFDSQGLTEKQILDVLVSPASVLSEAQDKILTDAMELVNKKLMQDVGFQGPVADAVISIQQAARETVSRQINTAMKGNVDDAVVAITNMVQNKRLSAIMGKGYVEHLKNVRGMLRRFGKAKTVSPRQVSKVKGKGSAVRNAVSALATGWGLLSLGSPAGLLVGGSVFALGRFIPRSPSIVDAGATRAASRALSDPTLFNDITRMKQARTLTQGVASTLSSISQELSAGQDDPVKAAVLSDGTVVPLLNEEGKEFSTFGEWAKTAIQYATSASILVRGSSDIIVDSARKAFGGGEE